MTLILALLISTNPQHAVGAGAVAAPAYWLSGSTATVGFGGWRAKVYFPEASRLAIAVGSGVAINTAFQAGELHAGHAWNWSRSAAGACGAVAGTGLAYCFEREPALTLAAALPAVGFAALWPREGWQSWSGRCGYAAWTAAGALALDGVVALAYRNRPAMQRKCERFAQAAAVIAVGSIFATYATGADVPSISFILHGSSSRRF